MSLLKWKELAKSKTELGKKINYVHNAITQRKIGDETSQESFGKLFKPVTSKLDDVIDSNLNLRMPKRIKRPPKKAEVPNYGIDIEDEVEEMGLDDLFGDYVPPQQEKQIVPKPPTYEESLQDLMEGKKKIYVDPQYFPGDLGESGPEELPQEYEELPPEYDEEVDYALDVEYQSNLILDDIGIPNYENVELILNQKQMTPKKTKAYLKKIINNASMKRNQLKGFKSGVTKQYNSGKITEAERQEKNKRINDANIVLKDYIDHYVSKLQSGSGKKRKQRGGNVMFFNDVKQLLNKLELIIGEVIAGNTSIQMRNTGVNILDTLLRMSTINKPQYNKLYNQYFKV